MNADEESYHSEEYLHLDCTIKLIEWPFLDLKTTLSKFKSLTESFFCLQVSHFN